MKIKLFEVRSSCTFIGIMATKVGATNQAEQYLLKRAGYYDSAENAIIVQELDGGIRPSTSDAYKQESNDIKEAHKYINLHFDELESGDVIDLEFISGKTSEPRIAQRLE